MFTDEVIVHMYFSCFGKLELKGETMLVNLVFTFGVDVVDVPDFIGQNLKRWQRKCDKWLFNKMNDHEFWIINGTDKKSAIGICSDAFVFYLNNHVLMDTSSKAVIVERAVDLSSYDKSYPTVFY